jgi:hypothetical protein
MSTQQLQTHTTLAGDTITVPTTAAAVPIAALAGPAILTLTITALTATGAAVPRARILFEDSVDAFTTPYPVASLNVEGVIKTPCTFSWAAREIPGFKIGTPAASVRVNVAELDGAGVSLTYTAALIATTPTTY